MVKWSDGTKDQRKAAMRLAAEVDCDPRTALAWLLRVGGTNGTTGYALDSAAAKMGIERAPAREAV